MNGGERAKAALLTAAIEAALGGAPHTACWYSSSVVVGETFVAAPAAAARNGESGGDPGGDPDGDLDSELESDDACDDDWSDDN